MTSAMESLKIIESLHTSSNHLKSQPPADNLQREELIELVKMTQQSLNRTLAVMDKVLHFLSSDAK